MFYMVKNNEYNHNAYFIHGHYVLSDHYPIQLEICIRSETSRKSFFKWNVSHLKEDFANEMRIRWDRMMKDVSIFFKIL